MNESKLERIINRGMDKQTMVHPYNGILLSNQKGLTAAWMNLKKVMPSKRSQIKVESYILHDSIF